MFLVIQQRAQEIQTSSSLAPPHCHPINNKKKGRETLRKSRQEEQSSGSEHRANLPFRFHSISLSRLEEQTITFCVIPLPDSQMF